MDGSWPANWNFLRVKPEVGPAGLQATPYAELRLRLSALLQPAATALHRLRPYVGSWLSENIHTSGLPPSAAYTSTVQGEYAGC